MFTTTITSQANTTYIALYHHYVYQSLCSQRLLHLQIVQ